MLLVNISHFTQCDTPDHCGVPPVTSHRVTHQTTVVYQQSLHTGDTPDHCGVPTVTSHGVTHQTTVVYQQSLHTV